MRSNGDAETRRRGMTVLALLACIVAMLAIAPLAQPALGYTEMWQPPYVDRMLVGGTSTTTATVMPGLVDAPANFCTVVCTLHMPAHRQNDTLATPHGVIYNPVIWPLNGAVTLVLGLPDGLNSSTLIPVPAAADSHAIQLYGAYSSFDVQKSGTADSSAATGYVVCGMAGPPLQYIRPR